MGKARVSEPVGRDLSGAVTMKDFDEREMWQMQDDRLLARVVGGLWVATGIVGLVLAWVVWG